MLAAAGLGRWIVGAGLALAVLALLVLLAGGPGTRLGWWHYRTGLAMLRWAALVALGGAVLALLGAALGGGWRAALAALALGLVAFALPWEFRRRVAAVPRIHDVTTDLEDPPAFQAVLPARAGAANPPEYPGEEVAVQQRAAYPDLVPITLAALPSEAFEHAVAAARSLGWEIVAADPAGGRLEATDTTFWFGFRDDVVVRVVPQGLGSRIDVRSKSRVGSSDVGANAARIRRFRERLLERAGVPPE
jgi:uncharacterized protein (DUF1499 family)